MRRAAFSLFACFSFFIVPLTAAAETPRAFQADGNEKSMWVAKSPGHEAATRNRVRQGSATVSYEGETVRSQSPSKSSTVLKWRARRPSAFRVNRELRDEDEPNAQEAWAQPEETIRPVSDLRPVDPFDDPFEDNKLRSRVVQADHQPAALSLEPPQNGMRSIAAQPIAPVEPEPLEPPMQVEPPPDAPPRPVAPARPEQLPEPKEPCAEQPCDEPYVESPDDVIYNERNCCQHQHHCRCQKELIKNTTIKGLSLDLSADYFLEGVDDPEKRPQRMERKEMIPSRVWKDRRGKVLAEGRLVDFRYGRAVIETADGKQQTLPPLRDLGEDEICFLTAYWDLPYECRFDELYRGLGTGREHWVASTVTWKASDLCHKPLYFEDVQLERYGHTAGPFRQPFKSTAHFFMNIAVLPYKLGMNHPGECQYALGYYRPGDCAPWLVDPVPISARGAAAQAAAVAGAIVLFP